MPTAASLDDLCAKNWRPPSLYAQLMWLLLMTPEAESLVDPWRAQHDPAARFGIPAHVTVYTPFLPPEDWQDPALSLLERFLPTEVTLARLENRPGGLVILAEPDDHLRAITAAGQLVLAGAASTQGKSP
jgi:hypothetical protein